MFNVRHKLKTDLAAVAVMLSVGTMLVPSAALAAVGGDHTPTIFDLGWFYANFVLYSLIMFMLLRGVVLKGWDARRERIEAAVEQGTRAAAEARRLLAEAEARSQRIPEEIEALKAKIEADTRAEVEAVVRDAASRIAAIKSQAQQLAAAEQRSTRDAVRHELARQVIAEARVRLRETMTPSVDEGLRARLIEQSAQVRQ